MADKSPASNEVLLKVAVTAALKAGQLLRDDQGQYRKIEKAADRDVKIVADRRAESVIVEQLRRRTPYAILSEEAGTIVAARPGQSRSWIIDPLDGSLNYHQGIPFCCISIAMYDGWKPVLGVVYDFNRGELFTGVVGLGAHCNGVPIRPSTTRRRQTAVLATGFPINRDFKSPALRQFIGQIKNFRKVRLLGSAALSLSYVACGRVDAYTEDNIMFWDVAAGCAIVRSAGGAIHVRHGDAMTDPVVVTAANRCLQIGK